MNVRPATDNDLKKWFPEGPPVPIKTLVLDHEGELLAIGGVAKWPEFYEAFSKVEPMARELPGGRMALGRWAARVANLIESTPGEVLAIADPEEPTAASLLAWVGFVKLPTGPWRYQPRMTT